MKINVVRDKSGKVVASFETGPGASTTLTPVLHTGERVEELDVPDNYRDNLAQFYEAKRG